MHFTIGAEYDFSIGGGPVADRFVGEVVTIDGTILVVRDKRGHTLLINTNSTLFHRALVIGPLPQRGQSDRTLEQGLGKFLRPPEA